jgi:hypothetical protein
MDRSTRSTRLLATALGLGIATVAGFAASSATAGGRPLSTDMTGAAEVPGPGDPDGTGTAEVTVNLGLGEICYELTVANIAPATMAHIHFAPAGVAGPIVVNLTPPISGSSADCAENVNPVVAKNILQHPEQYYVNVHNAEWPSGAVRGQLSK